MTEPGETAARTSIVRRNAVANFAGSGWAAVMTIVFIPVYIRMLGIEAYAVIALLPVFYAWLAFLDAAIAPVLSREVARYRAGARDALSTVELLKSAEMFWLVAAAIAVLVFVAADRAIATLWLNAGSLPPSTVARGIDLIALLAMLRLLEAAYHGALVGLQQLVWYNGWIAALATLRHGGAAIVVMFVSPTIEAYFAWQVAISLATVVLFGIRVHRAIGKPATRVRPSLRRLSEVWRFAAGTSTITVMAIIVSQVDKLLLSKLVTLEAFGVYMLASSVASALYVTIVPLSQAVYPRMVDLVARGRDAELSALYHASAAGVSVVSGSVAAVLFFMPAEAIYAWSADASLATRVAPILAPAVLGTFLHGLTNIPYQLQLAHGWTGLSLRLHVACAVVYIPVLFAIVPIYGGVGAAWSWVALNLALATFLALLMHRRLLPGEFARWLLSDVAAPIAAAIAVAVIAGRLIAPLESSRLGLAFALIGIGMVTVAAAALVVPAVRRGSFAALRKAWV